MVGVPAASVIHWRCLQGVLNVQGGHDFSVRKHKFYSSADHWAAADGNGSEQRLGGEVTEKNIFPSQPYISKCKPKRNQILVSRGLWPHQH